MDEKGDVIYVDPPAGGGLDCRWEDMSSVTISGEQDIRLGFDPTSNCYRGKVGLGLQVVKDAKLTIYSTHERDAVRIGALVMARGDQDTQPNKIIGVAGSANGVQASGNLSNTYIGVSGDAGAEYTGKYNVGVEAKGTGQTGAALAFGLYASAKYPLGNSIGVYTEGSVGLYRVGIEITTGPSINISDESVKTNVNDLESATALLSQMQPKSYLMQNPENRDLHFDEGIQYGFLAQEMQEVFPDIVREVVIPEKMDSTGFVEGTSVSLLGIKYESLIPVLVAGFNEQNSIITGQVAQIASQNESINALEAQLQAQATQLEEMQNDMQSVLAAVQTMQQKTANCCTLKSGGGEA